MSSVADPGTVAAVTRPGAGATGPGVGPSTRRVVLVAPRLVDEVRAVGLLAALDGAAPEVDLLGLTSPVAPADPDEGADDSPDDAPDPHHAAVLAAYARVGAPEVRRHRLGLAAGEIAAREADVVAALSEILGWAHPAGLCVLAPPSGEPAADPGTGPDGADSDADADADADAAGRAAELVCAAYRVRLLTWDGAGATPPSRAAGLATAAGA